MDKLIIALTKLNIAINYSDPDNKLSGSILLDSEDWATILSSLNQSGYRVENRNITLEVQNGKIGTR